MSWKERIGKHNQFQYIPVVGGSIGVLANGAGLCMATGDYLTSAGVKPANFTDIYGDTSQSKLQSALQLLEIDEQVQSILVNVFCGDLRADFLAFTIREAYKTNLITKKMVCRIKGNESEACNKILADMNEPRITIEQDFEKAC